jgi:uncharacterized membrane protein
LHIRSQMSIQDYLHEKAEESRHNEIIAYLMFLTGAVFLVGGILSTLTLTGEPSWFLFVPYRADLSQGTFLELTFLVVGFCLIFVGIAAGLHYYRDRSWYMQELQRANSPAQITLNKKIPKNALKKKK